MEFAVCGKVIGGKPQRIHPLGKQFPQLVIVLDLKIDLLQYLIVDFMKVELAKGFDNVFFYILV